MRVVHMPELEERMETGVVQFGDDWPGLFIRGDNAFGYAVQLQGVTLEDPIADANLKSLVQLLFSAASTTA